MKISTMFILILACVSLVFGQKSSTLLIRCDDIGMCHAVNEAITKVLKSDIKISASVMFVCPWYQEAIEILKKFPNIAVGVHLTLNAEWANYRWGPVAGWKSVPSLTDSNGYFFPSRSTFFANMPKLNEVETELRSQINRAIKSGLKIDYLDYHMGTAVSTPEFRTIVEKLASEYNLGISRYYGETEIKPDSAAVYPDIYFAPPAEKINVAISLLKRIKDGERKLMVLHIGLETPEMNALQDMNPNGPKEMSKYRQGELNILLSEKFRKLITDQGTRLIDYRDLNKEIGKNNMRRP
jgi:chitin disaccharide deacetylase